MTVFSDGSMLKWLADLVEDDVVPPAAVIPVDAFGLNSNQSKVFFWRHERFPVPLAPRLGKRSRRPRRAWNGPPGP